MKSCIFCKIARQEALAYIIWQDELTVAFLDINPVSWGHTLVVSKQHFRNFCETDEHLLTHMAQITQQLTKKIAKKLNVNDFTILTNQGTIAGQEVMHFHIHIIPRVKLATAKAQRLIVTPQQLSKLQTQLI